jgi:hypothetical protein
MHFNGEPRQNELGVRRYSRTNSHHRDTVYGLRMESMYLYSNDFEIESDPLGITSKINEYHGDTVFDMHLRLVYLNGVIRSN